MIPPISKLAEAIDQQQPAVLGTVIEVLACAQRAWQDLKRRPSALP